MRRGGCPIGSVVGGPTIVVVVVVWGGRGHVGLLLVVPGGGCGTGSRSLAAAAVGTRRLGSR
jgi:hypothetical protein